VYFYLLFFLFIYTYFFIYLFFFFVGGFIFSARVYASTNVYILLKYIYTYRHYCHLTYGYGVDTAVRTGTQQLQLYIHTR
jgi:hypothetical protein